MASSADITQLLHRWGAGDTQALDELMPLLYERMRQLAHRQLRSEPGASLNTTALVHEACLRLVHAPQESVRNRGDFRGLGSRVIRHLLVDRDRLRKVANQVLGVTPLQLDEWVLFAEDEGERVAQPYDALYRV